MRLGVFRNWRPVAAWSMVCLMAACGGGHDGGTGPGGGGGGGNDLAGDYSLISANDGALPATYTSNICDPALFTGGSLTLHSNGSFEMSVSYTNDDGGNDGFQDHGSYRRNGDQLQFESEAWGDEFEGELDGGLVWTYYDFCNDNQGADLDLAFAP